MLSAHKVWKRDLAIDVPRPVGISRRPRTQSSDETGLAVFPIMGRRFVQFTSTQRVAFVPYGQALRSINGDRLMLLKLTCIDRFFVDALITDGNSKLLFLSAWCRDTVAQEFLAKMSLNASDDGFLGSVLEFVGPETIRVSLSKDAKLEKRQGRVSGGVFGDGLINLWVFNSICSMPDTANAKAVLLSRSDDHEDVRDRLWSTIKMISTAPLLDHWRDDVIHAFETQGWITTRSGFGVSALLVELSDAVLLIGEMVRSGELTPEPLDSDSDDSWSQEEAA